MKRTLKKRNYFIHRGLNRSQILFIKKKKIVVNQNIYV